MNRRAALQLIGLLAALAVLAGAFGAHGLSERVTAARLAAWNTGVRYLMWHAIAALAVVLAVTDLKPWRGILAAWLGGAVVFTGSLFALVLLDMPGLGAITPAGGIAMVAGWVLLFRGALLDKLQP